MSVPPLSVTAGAAKTGPVRPRLELPTLLLTLAVYGGWLSLTLMAADGHLWAWPGLVILLALHSSLQHELIHGHPTRSERVNAWLAGVPLSLWLPFTVYRRTHREHHASSALTDPRLDPESFYVGRDRYDGRGRLWRAYRWSLQTLVGRLVLGPIAMVIGTGGEEWHRWRRLDVASRRAEVVGLLVHLLGVVLVVGWLVVAARLSLALYVVAGVYPSMSLTLLRSYAEHTPHAEVERRTVVVESWLFGWIYLHNNLHVVHHEAPGLPWYQLPGRWRARRAHYLARGVRVYRGYRSFGCYLVRPKDAPVYPG